MSAAAFAAPPAGGAMAKAEAEAKAAVEAGCFHCGQPVPPGARWQVAIGGAPRAMCCPGCEAVAQAIVDLGQADYYRTRTGPAATGGAGALPPELALYDAPAQAARFAREDGLAEAVLTVEGIRCAACVWLIEKRVARVPGVLSAELNVAGERLLVRWDGAVCKPSDVLRAVREVGYDAYPYDTERHGEHLRRAGKRLSRQLFVAGLGMMQVMMYAFPAYVAEDGTLDADMAALMRWASLLLTLPVVLYAALPFFQGALAGLRARVVGMDLPVALGVAAAFGASAAAVLRGQGEVYFDSVTMFVFLLLCSRYLELAARRKSAAAAERLHHALPASATRLPGWPGARSAVTVAAAELAAGDIVLVRPGEAAPADGVLVEGAGAFDLSLLTGESAPQARAIGEDVPGGAINTGSAVLLRATRAAGASTLAELVRLVERAGRARPRIASWADRVGAWFVAALLLLALGAFAAWRQIDPARAWPVAIAVLVVSCPCALSLATPAVLAAATGRLLRRGVVITRGHALEVLQRATHVVFDKTGTLTLGQPAVHAVTAMDGGDADALLALAQALARVSAHPASTAVARAACAAPARTAVEVAETPGQGLAGSVDGVRYRLGNAAFAGGAGAAVPAGGTRLFLAGPDGLLAVIDLRDAVRPDAQAVVRACRAMGKTVVLLSGDAPAVVRAVADQLGIADAEGACLPADKLRRVQALQAGGAVVAMVGDGVNDAAALQAADVSFAMRGGAALAHAHADGVLLAGDLAAFADAAGTAAKAMRLIRQNLAWAMLYNAVAIPAAALGWLNPWLSSVGMAASSAIVVANALRAGRA